MAGHIGPVFDRGPRQLEQRLQTCRGKVGAEVEAGGGRLRGGGVDARRGALLRSEEAGGLVRVRVRVRNRNRVRVRVRVRARVRVGLEFGLVLVLVLGLG